MALKSDGLTDVGFGPGLTTNFQVQYDDSLGNVANLKANANALLAVIENEFTVTTGWFATPGGKFSTGNRQVVRLNKGDGSGANNTGYGNAINLDAQSGNANAANAAGIVGMVFMNEWVEILMSLSGGKWNAGDSMGEALSQYCGIVRFQTGHYNYYNSWTAQWMNTVPRQDWVTQTEGTDGNAVSFGCALGFIYYLNTQLNFSINQIIAAGTSNLAGVCKTLTGDGSSPYPFFSGLLEHVYPSSATTNLPGPIPDNPFPLAELSFWVDKSTFGKDEVQDVINASAGVWSRAFWLVVEGFSKNSFTALGVAVGNFTGQFTALNGVTIVQRPDVDFENAAQPQAPQRIRIPFDVRFTSASLADFPGSGSTTYELDVNLTIAGKVVPGSSATTILELVAGADPYFTNVDPAQNNVFYLSQDLRVFTATPALNNLPVPGGPVFPSDDFNGAYGYVQQLLGWLNGTYSDPNGTDPFASLLPAQGAALQSDSSVTPFTITWSGFVPTVSRNYNFAIARVRMRGTAGPAGQANDVRVFFRLWSTQTADTDYAPSITYPSVNDGAGHPKTPLVGAGNGTLPFFATGNIGANSDYPGPNARNVAISSGDSVWAYYGCFLNVYDPANQVGGQPVLALLNGSHHCLVAQIAQDDAPVVFGASPESSDKLAQRNLQVTGSDNPGGPLAHRIPQTFDIRPSAKVGVLDYPDELMIDWGKIPVGSAASIYWPQVLASEVLFLARQLYGSQTLSASDAHTIQCTVTGGVTYVPIPTGAGESFAGLFTVDLPTTVVAGQEFDIVVRRVGTKPIDRIVINTPRMRQTMESTRGKPQAKVNVERDQKPGELILPSNRYRYVVGTFQVKIPVATADSLLVPEMNTLAIMKWRLSRMASSNRWYLVLKRYIGYIADRVQGLGGDPASILPSPDGVPASQIATEQEREFMGKVCEVLYDCFGDFEGFVLRQCCNDTHAFKSRERGIEELVLRACRDRMRVTVVVDPKDKSRICGIAVRC